MNNLMLFENHKVEVFEWNGEILFNPYHVGNCLDLSESAVKMAVSKMNENQVIKLTNSKVNIVDFRKLHNTGENFLTESGVYKLIFKSRKPDAEKFQDWVTDEVLPAIRKTGTYTKVSSTDELKIQKMETQKARAEAMLLNAKNRTFKTLMSVMKDKKLSPIAVEVFQLKGLESVFGIEVGNYLPETEKTYSATEVGNLIGCSANKIGKLAKDNKLKTQEYGMWVMDKSRYSSKEVSVFRYNNKAVERFKELLEDEKVIKMS